MAKKTISEEVADRKRQDEKKRIVTAAMCLHRFIASAVCSGMRMSQLDAPEDIESEEAEAALAATTKLMKDIDILCSIVET